MIHFATYSIHLEQRKNGLFKKAYELGVLCSVDVAVIIFGLYLPPCLSSLFQFQFKLICVIVSLYILEERAGHHVKLHEYCSTDIDTMIQRHLHVRIDFSRVSPILPVPSFSISNSPIVSILAPTARSILFHCPLL